MTTKPRVEWNDSNISTASKLWADGKTVSALAEYFNVSRSTVSGMINRNRDKFKTRGKVGGNTRINWTDEMVDRAAALWKLGNSVRKIAAAMGQPSSTVGSIVFKNHRDKFPKREKVKHDGRSVRKRSRSELNEPPRAFVGNAETQASERYDFTRYQIEGTTPIAYWKLSGCQCHFPLERFEEKSGPETPCCGQKTIEGRSYCNTHWKLMHEGGRE